MKTISCPLSEKCPNWPSSPILGEFVVWTIWHLKVSTWQVMKLARFWFLHTQVNVNVEREVQERAVK
jgi:hypothetical protein